MKKVLLVSVVLLFSLLGCAGVPSPTPEQLASADYGHYPANYQEIATQYISNLLIDPNSAMLSGWIGPSKTWSYTDRGESFFGYGVCMFVNAKNRMGGYTGRQLFFVLIKDDRVLSHNGGYPSGTVGEEVIAKRCSELLQQKIDSTRRILEGEDRRYVNKDKGFSIMFPAYWEISENAHGLTVEAHGASDNLHVPEHLAIRVEELPVELNQSEQDMAFSNFLETLKKNPDNIVLELNDANINNVQGKSLIYSVKNNPNSKNMLFSTGKGHRMYIFSFSAESSRFQKCKSQVEQILKSFNFE